MKKTTVLCVLDGVGENPDPVGNAVAQANTPNLDRFYKTYPHSQLLTQGEAVGLPEGQMGNSEVGHTNLGAGRVVHQMLERIRGDMNNGDFTGKEQVKTLLKQTENSPAVHLVGLVSDGGIHSHSDHLIGLVKALVKTLAPLGKPVYIHAITDGIDTSPRDAINQLSKLKSAIADFENISIVDLCGRFYAMDRDNRDERTNLAYDLFANGKAEHQADGIKDAVEQARKRTEDDNFILPTVLKDGKPAQKDDTIVFFNFRADRMRQIVKAFIDGGFANLFTMTQYDSIFQDSLTVLYPPETLKNTLGDVVAKAGRTQFRIAETEKYAHVTFFFNGGAEKPFAHENRKIVPSPKVRTYDLQPEMSVAEVGKDLFAAIRGGQYDMIVCNIANGDMVGHTGNFAAAIKAMEAVDVFLEGLEEAIKANGGHLLLTADHGNCEKMLDADGEAVTSHSMFPVPLFYIGPENAGLENGVLADIAPTMLRLMGLDVPAEMTGRNLLETN
mgnify:CR=1 FL=1